MQKSKKVEALGRKARLDVQVDSDTHDSPSDPIAAALAARKQRLGEFSLQTAVTHDSNNKMTISRINSAS
jgi:hypothetical protein